MTQSFHLEFCSCDSSVVAKTKSGGHLFVSLHTVKLQQRRAGEFVSARVCGLLIREW